MISKVANYRYDIVKVSCNKHQDFWKTQITVIQPKREKNIATYLKTLRETVESLLQILITTTDSALTTAMVSVWSWSLSSRLSKQFQKVTKTSKSYKQHNRVLEILQTLDRPLLWSLWVVVDIIKDNSRWNNIKLYWKSGSVAYCNCFVHQEARHCVISLLILSRL